MKTANLSQVKDHLSAYVERARVGEPVRILVRGVPAADLVPACAELDDAGLLPDLQRRGIVRIGAGDVDDELLRPGPSVRGSPSDDLVKERRAR